LEPGDDEAVGIHDFRRRVGHGRGADRHLQGDDGTRVAEAGAMIHVVRSDDGAEHLLQQIILFVGRLSAAEDRQRVRAMSAAGLRQAVGHQV
jgi:hypothetical protein